MFTTRRQKLIAGVVAALAAVALVAVGVVWWVFRDLGAKHITAYFDEAVGVYAGSDLRILGVRVGTIDAVTPSGTQVRVDMTLDDGITVPASAEAVVVSPSVVSDRYVQLSPVYRSGPQLVDNAVIPSSRTATPVELDQLYQSLDQLATALGPNGANANGALSDLLTTGANNLAGNGQALGQMIQQFGAATRTLSGSANDLFGTISNLQQFTAMLKSNDGQVRESINQLSQVSGFLAEDRQDLGGALNELATALGQVQTFIQDNRGAIQSNVEQLARISQLLVNQRASIAQALDELPLAADNLLNAYDPTNGTIDGRANLLEQETPAAQAQGAKQHNPSAQCALGVLCQQNPTTGGLVPAGTSGLPALPLPAAGPVYTVPTGTGGGQ